MNKIKIIKGAVFLLTFAVVFVFVILCMKVVKDGRGAEFFDIKIADTADYIKTEGDWLYIKGEKCVYIINSQKQRLAGKVCLSGDTNNGI